MFVQTLFVHISHVNTTSPKAQIPFYWTLIAYFSPRHLTQEVGRSENAYLELQNATRFNRLRNLTSNFSNTKVRIVHLKAISLGVIGHKITLFVMPSFWRKNDFRNDFRFPSKFRLENFVIILNSLKKQRLNPFLSWTSFTSPWNGHLEFFRPALSLLFFVVVAFFGL